MILSYTEHNKECVHRRPVPYPSDTQSPSLTILKVNSQFLNKTLLVKVAQSCPTLCDPHGLYSPWNSLGQNTGVGSLSLLQGIFPTQGLNPGLPALQAGSLSAEPQGKPHVLRDMYMKKFYLALLKWFIFTFFFFGSLKLYVSVVSVMF